MGAGQSQRQRAPPASAPPSALRGTASQRGLLTPKEAQISGLLNADVPYKPIARTLDVSRSTVKWHLEKRFLSLSAASRRYAVDRVRLLGPL